MAVAKSKLLSETCEYFEQLTAQIEANLDSSNGVMKSVSEWTSAVDQCIEVKAKSSERVKAWFEFINSVKSEGLQIAGREYKAMLTNMGPSMQTELAVFLKNVSFQPVKKIDFFAAFNLQMPKYRCLLNEDVRACDIRTSQLRLEVDTEDSFSREKCAKMFLKSESRDQVENRLPNPKASQQNSASSRKYNTEKLRFGSPKQLRSAAHSRHQSDDIRNAANFNFSSPLKLQDRTQKYREFSGNKMQESGKFDEQMFATRNEDRNNLVTSTRDSRFWKNDENLLSDFGPGGIDKAEFSGNNELSDSRDLSKVPKPFSPSMHKSASNYIRRITPNIPSGFKPLGRQTETEHLQSVDQNASQGRHELRNQNSNSKSRKTLRNFVENSKVKELRIEPSKSPNKVIQVEVRRSVSISNQEAKNCANLKRLSVGKFANQLRDLRLNRLLSLDLTSGDIGDEQVSALLGLLEKATYLRHLSLAKNKITDQTVKIMTSFLLNSNIETLDLSFNKISALGFKYLFVISQSKGSKIRSVSLKHNLFDARNRAAMVEKFKQIGVLLEV